MDQNKKSFEFSNWLYQCSKVDYTLLLPKSCGHKNETSASTISGDVIGSKEPFNFVSFYVLGKIPYQTKICRTKLSKFWLGVENFVRYFNTKVRQKLDKIVEISA